VESHNEPYREGGQLEHDASNGTPQENYRVVKADDWPRVKDIKAEDIAWLDTGVVCLVCTNDRCGLYNSMRDFQNKDHYKL
jgi:hypothetical protein